MKNKVNQNFILIEKLHRYLILYVLCFFIISCENEKYNEKYNETIEGQSTDHQIDLKNGRLYFQNKDLFVKFYNENVNLSEEKLDDLLMPLYKRGFYSLIPIVTEKNEAFIFEHYKEKLASINPVHNLFKRGELPPDPMDDPDPFEEIREIIGDDTFALYLNIDGEIQIGEEIYKYTDVGIFIVDETEYATLDDYLNEENISDNLFNETSYPVKEDIVLLLPENLPTPVGPRSKIVYYRPPSIGQIDSGSYNTPTPGSTVANDPNYNTFFNNLGNCDPHPGIFGNLFGDNNVCIDGYESRRRVKTKAFNYNYLLVYHTGVKCVNQFRGWTGFWRVEAADEIRLVVESVQFEYDRDALLGNNVINNQTKERAYFLNGQKAFFSGPNTITFLNEWGQPIISYINLTSLPKIFQDDLTFEFFGTGSSYIDELIQNGIDSNLKATKLNELFYTELYSTAKSQLQTAFGSSTSPPSNRTFVAKFPENGKIIFQKSVLSQGFDVGVREKTFDFGAKICLTAGDSSNWNIKADMGCDIIVLPTNFRVKMIGAVRKGNQWHGSKFGVGID